jgi:hypothetical protein
MDTSRELQEALRDLFSTLTPDQLAILTQLHTSLSPESPGTTPQSLSSGEMNFSDASTPPQSLSKGSRTRESPRARAKKAKPSKSPKKALNAFIAYRS